MQLGFGDGWISPKVGQNATLERLAAEVKWYRFEKLLAGLRPQGAGRPPFSPLLMLKALLLQQWYALSDADLEEAVNDRVSFRKFLGLGLKDAQGGGWEQAPPTPIEPNHRHRGGVVTAKLSPH